MLVCPKLQVSRHLVTCSHFNIFWLECTVTFLEHLVAATFCKTKLTGLNPSYPYCSLANTHHQSVDYAHFLAMSTWVLLFHMYSVFSPISWI